MKSHTYEFGLPDLLRMLVGPLATVATFAAFMHLGASLRMFPSPSPTLDTDRTILIHQADASRRTNPAKILLLGDSSCLMGVSAKLLSQELRLPVLNLATLSYLDAGANSRLLREFVAAHPGQLRAVVLLMHPEALRRIGSEPYQFAVLTSFLAATDQHRTETAAGQFSCWLGLDIFQGRLLARTVPTPLAGSFGHEHGFSWNLEDFMTTSLGSLPEPDSAPLTGSTEYRLSAALETGARQFKASVPPGVKLLVGLTPVPEKLAGPDFGNTRLTLLRQWSDWLGADLVLNDLPASLPDDRFARSTHLKPAAVGDYTTLLARSISAHW